MTCCVVGVAEIGQSVRLGSVVVGQLEAGQCGAQMLKSPMMVTESTVCQCQAGAAQQPNGLFQRCDRFR